MKTMTAKSDTSVRYAINRIIKSANTRKTTLMVLSCVVVFITTYILILPAITLEQDEAAKQGGIDVTTEQQADVTTEDSEVSEDNEVLEEPVASEEAAPADKLTFEGKGYTALAECEGANLPSDTEVVAKEIGKKDKDYKTLYKDALEAVQKANNSKTVDFAFAKFYDISLMSDGESIEPDIPVDVTISYDKALKAFDADNLRIVHFAVDEETGEVSPEVLDSDLVSAEINKGKMKEATFAAASFSVYAIVYTVDFEYDVDGQKFTYSIEGGSKINLADLLLQLQAIKDDPDTEVDEVQLFMDEIDKVEFSSPKLVRVEQDDGGWILTSLKPFDSTETLTVTMKNGDVFTVKVTDAQISSIQDGHQYVIYYLNYIDNKYYALKGDGSTVQIDTSDGVDHALNFLGNDYLWTFDYLENHNTWNVYSNKGLYLNVDSVHAASGSVVSSTPMATGIQFDCDSYGDDYNFWYASVLEGYTTYYLMPDLYQNEMIVDAVGYYDDPEPFFIFDQSEKRLNFTVKTEYNNTYRGTVGGKDYTQYISELDKGASHDPAYRDHLASYIGVTNKGSDGLTNKDAITAEAGLGYRFKGWKLDDQFIDESYYSAVEQGEKTIYRIEAGALPFQKDNQILTAVFEKIPNSEGVYDYSELVNNWKQEQIADQLSVDKTAEVYDYDNRIYEVDITASGNARIIQPDLEIAFVTDISRSMYFPSKLTKAETFTSKEDLRSKLNSLRDNHYAENHSSDKDAVYYLLANESSDATVYAVRYDDDENRWEIIDASYDVLTHDKTGAPGTKLGQTWDWPFLMDGHWQYNNGQWQYQGGGIFDQNGNVYLNNALDNNTSKKLLKGEIYVASDSVYRLEYLQQAVDIASEVVYTVNDEARIGLVTFAQYSGTEHRYGFFSNDEYSNLISALNNISPVGRTDQLRGLQNAHGMFSDQAELDETGQPKDKKKVVVLITDGAPNNTGTNGNPNLNWNNIKQEARNIESDLNATVFTVGLAVDGIKDGNVDVFQRLQETATQPNYAFNAKDGEQLVRAILDIVDKQITLADIYGTVTDTVDPAFYPVKPDGTPIEPGYYNRAGYSINPNAIAALDASHTEYYQWSRVGETWVITWYNVLFEQEKEEGGVKTPGIDRNFLIKAKEDFLGGNTINTNMGKASATATHYQERVQQGQQTKPIVALAKQIVRQMDTPYVNIDELEMNGHESEWTVYLGTNVDPKAQLEAMFKDIKIREVVTSSKSQAHQMGITYASSQVMDNGETIYDVQRGAWEDNDETLKNVEPSTFTLADVINSIEKRTGAVGGLIQTQWNNLLAGQPITLKYFGDPAYGHGTSSEPVGTIKIQLTKNIAQGEGSLPDAHNTTVTNAENNNRPVEQYTLNVTYTPTAPTKSYDEYHTGTFVNEEKQPGVETGTMTSVNTHIINVLEKAIQITKVDESNNPITEDEATFTLYKQDDSGSTVEGLPEGKYVPAGTLTTGDNGKTAKLSLVPNLNDDSAATNTYIGSQKTYTKTYTDSTQYYLLETDAPDGYKKYDQGIPVELNVEEKKTPLLTDNSGNVLLYNWDQTSEAVLIASDHVDITDNGAADDVIKFNVKNDQPADIILKKYEKGSHQQIAGAKFSLKLGSEYADFTNYTIVELDENGDPTETPAEIETIHNSISDTDIEVIVVPKNGVRISGLAAGEYTLKEEAAPTGYILTNNDIAFTVAEGKVLGDKVHEFSVENEFGAELPEAGGPGTTWIYLIGSLLLLGCGIALVTRRKMRI